MTGCATCDEILRAISSCTDGLTPEQKLEWVKQTIKQAQEYDRNFWRQRQKLERRSKDLNDA